MQIQKVNNYTGNGYSNYSINKNPQFKGSVDESVVNFIDKCIKNECRNNRSLNINAVKTKWGEVLDILSHKAKQMSDDVSLKIVSSVDGGRWGMYQSDAMLRAENSKVGNYIPIAYNVYEYNPSAGDIFITSNKLKKVAEKINPERIDKLFIK